MPYMPCPECGKTGKIKVPRQISRDTVGEAEEECPLCHGERWVYEDATPLVVQELTEIKNILKEIREAQNGRNKPG